MAVPVATALQRHLLLSSTPTHLPIHSDKLPWVKSVLEAESAGSGVGLAEIGKFLRRLKSLRVPRFDVCYLRAYHVRSHQEIMLLKLETASGSHATINDSKSPAEVENTENETSPSAPGVVALQQRNDPFLSLQKLSSCRQN